ncbi:hypothetical protein G7Y89_g5448 [Cudoniella acicularis]|uniref:PCI domain-containing protein n=1 Tax=Cudoniella acicularis TaxID=354080 RepID=A0A8H4W3D6_9HELO|nr:hypothetical protein G7Y89_g5448 [Cudoniella acicularis]
MEQTKALNALEPFLALTKSASSPRAAADLIARATSAPNTFIFNELLCTPQIQALSNSEEYASHLTLLKVFSYGTYTSYFSTPGLPTLNEAQLLKLRQLSFLSLAKNPADLSYANLMTALGLRTPRELEDLVISAIYAGLVTATLDPYHQLVAVSSVSPLRDLQPNSIPSMIHTLDEWSSRCSSTLLDLEKQIANIKATALRRHKEEQEWEREVEKLVEGKGDKEKENQSDGKGGVGSLFSSMGRRLGGGAAAKRGVSVMGIDGEDDEDTMDVDDDDEDASERRGTRSAKKRGFGLLGSK